MPDQLALQGGEMLKKCFVTIRLEEKSKMIYTLGSYAILLYTKENVKSG